MKESLINTLNTLHYSCNQEKPQTGAKYMTTHRLIQIHNLEDTMSSKSRIARRAADNLARIGNNIGAGHYLRAAIRFERIADKCNARLELAS